LADSETNHNFLVTLTDTGDNTNKDKLQQESLALASMARDDPPASSMAPTSSKVATMRGKVGSEFET